MQHLLSQHDPDGKFAKMSDAAALQIFTQMKKNFKWPQTLIDTNFFGKEHTNMKVSLYAAFKLCKAKLPHTAGDFVKDIASKIVTEKIGARHQKSVAGCCLSRKTLKDCTNLMAEDVCSTVVARIKASPFGYSLQADESTDANKRVHLALCARFLVKAEDGYGYEVQEEMLCCLPTGGKTAVPVLKAAQISS